MNTNVLFFGSGFMMLAALTGFFLQTHFSMLKRKAVRVRIDNRNYDNRKPNNLR